MPLVLGVDSSTRSTKVEVRDLDTGHLVARGRSPHPSTRPPRSEQSPSVWWHALVDAIHRAGERDVAAMSVAGQQHGLVAIDRAGSVLRPAKLWNDTEATADARRLVRMAGADRWASSTGSVPVPSLTVSKLAWLRRREPQVFARIGTVLLPHDWLTYRLSGRLVTDRGDASGTGYWSPFDEAWRPDVLRLIDDRWSERDWLDRLPTVLGPGDRADWVAAPTYELLGLRGRPLVGPGTGHHMAASLGIGLRPGRSTVSVDTCGTVFAVSEAPTADASGAVAGLADATGRFLPLARTLDATRVTDAVARLLGVDLGGLGALASAAERRPGEDPVLLPSRDDERTPDHPAARGLLAAIGSDVTREQLARAAIDGVVCSLLDGLEALTRAGVEIFADELSVVGPGARSEGYRRALADLSGLPVVVPEGDGHVAAGACVQAAAVLGGADPAEVARAWGLGRGGRTEPRPVDREGVRGAYAAVRDAAPALHAAASP